MGLDPNELAEPLRTSVLGLLAEANEGGTKRVTIVSGRRSSDEQIRLRREHCGTSHYDIYDKPAKQCHPDTARPGTSKHEVGLAVDFGGDLGLVAKLAPKYGLVKTVPSEDWHYEHRGTASATAAAQDSDPPPLGQGGSSVGISDLGGMAGAAFDAITSPAQAIAAFGAAVLNPRTWFRAGTAVLGVGLVVVGVVVLSRDLIVDAAAAYATGGASAAVKP